MSTTSVTTIPAAPVKTIPADTNCVVCLNELTDEGAKKVVMPDCGHPIHVKCHSIYCQTEKTDHEYLSPERRKVTCSVCRKDTLGNVDILEKIGDTDQYKKIERIKVSVLPGSQAQQSSQPTRTQTFEPRTLEYHPGLRRYVSVPASELRSFQEEISRLDPSILRSHQEEVSRIEAALAPRPIRQELRRARRTQTPARREQTPSSTWGGSLAFGSLVTGLAAATVAGAAYLMRSNNSHS